MEKKEAVDKVLGFLREFAGEVGGTAKELWPYAVDNYQWNAISIMIGGGMVIIFFAFAAHKAKAYSAELVLRANSPEGKERRELHLSNADFTSVVSLVLLGVGFLIGTLMIVSRLADALSPVGGLLRKILGS